MFSELFLPPWSDNFYSGNAPPENTDNATIPPIFLEESWLQLPSEEEEQKKSTNSVSQSRRNSISLSCCDMLEYQESIEQSPSEEAGQRHDWEFPGLTSPSITPSIEPDDIHVVFPESFPQENFEVPELSQDNTLFLAVKRKTTESSLSKDSIKEKSLKSASYLTKRRKEYERNLQDNDEDYIREKQERNRISAKECRKRKKEYYENLEEQVKTLEQELESCRRELALSNGGPKSELEKLSGQLRSLSYSKDQYMENARILLLNANKDQLKELLRGYSKNSTIQKEAVNILAQMMTKSVSSKVDQYFLDSAYRSCGIFDIDRKKALESRGEVRDLQYFQLICIRKGDDLWDFMKFRKSTKRIYSNFKKTLTSAREELEIAAARFVTAKEAMMAKSKEVSSLIDHNTSEMLSAETRVQLYQWILENYEDERSSVRKISKATSETSTRFPSQDIQDKLNSENWNEFCPSQFRASLYLIASQTFL